jgi:uncharacterized protein (DUF362 family)
MPMKRAIALCAFLVSVAAGAARGDAVVSVVKGDDVDKMVAQALALAGGLDDLVKDGQTVVIKPNMVTPDKAKAPGLMTDVRVVRALVMEIRRAAPTCKIIVAEGCAPEPQRSRDTIDGFKLNGYMELVEKYAVELRDLNNDRKVTVAKPALLAYPKYEMAQTIMTCDVLIDVPLLKTHELAGVTIGLKNLFGLMPPPRLEFHGKLSGVLCDLLRIRRPDLTVVDGLWGTEGQGPLGGSPVKMDLIIAGRDVVAVDAVGAAIMGYDPKRIRAIALAGNQALGESDLAKITVKGRPIDSVKRFFAYARWDARLTCPKTDALVKKILSMADKVEDCQWHHRVVGKLAIFNPQRLTPDTTRYPLRKSFGFTVGIFDEDAQIEFQAPYETVLEENGQAAKEELSKWIEENLAIKVQQDPDARSRPSAKLW